MACLGAAIPASEHGSLRARGRALVASSPGEVRAAGLCSSASVAGSAGLRATGCALTRAGDHDDAVPPCVARTASLGAGTAKRGGTARLSLTHRANAAAGGCAGSPLTGDAGCLTRAGVRQRLAPLGVSVDAKASSVRDAVAVVVVQGVARVFAGRTHCSQARSPSGRRTAIRRLASLKAGLARPVAGRGRTGEVEAGLC